MARFINAVAIVALAIAATQAHAGGGVLALQPGSKLWLTGKSTAHAYSSTASKLDVKLEADPARWDATLATGEAIERLIREHGITAIDVTVAVNGMRSGKDGLDKNMSKALLADKHPQIRFVLGEYTAATGNDPTVTTIESQGKVTVAGVERDVKMSATAKREGDAVRVKGSVPLLMTQFGIKPPTMMMGTLRTSDDVVVHFDLLIGTADAKGATQ